MLFTDLDTYGITCASTWNVNLLQHSSLQGAAYTKKIIANVSDKISSHRSAKLQGYVTDLWQSQMHEPMPGT